MIRIVLFVIPYLLVFSLKAQKGEMLLTGKVVDVSTSTPLSYASVQIYDLEEEALLEGGITDEAGRFQLKISPGNRYLLIDFIGYEQLRTSNLTIEQGVEKQDLGILKLSVASSTLDEVIVQAEKSTMEFALDKRIFNVGKDLGNAGGSADEILNNIPSVLVDGEGNVKLRGSSNVRLLIDGKPSGLVSFKGGAGLQQLPASLIDKVEVITNPSARYEAEGMAGIINIVLKKEQKKGLNGSFETTGGYPLNLGFAANLNYRHRQVNFFLNYGMNYRKIPSVYTINQELYGPGPTFFSHQNYDGEHVGFFNNIRGGLDYFINEKNILTASYRYFRSKGKRLTDLSYEDYFEHTPNDKTVTLRTQDEDEIEPIAEYVLSYKKLFDKKEQELNAEVRYFDHWEDSDQVYTEKTFLSDGSLVNDFTQTAPNDETEKQLIIQVDYVHPIGEEGKAEAGLRGSIRDMTNDYVVNNVDNSGREIPIPELDNKFVYKENIYAAYGIIGNKTNRFSYQAGLRVEWTDIETILEETATSNPRNYANLFPSAHFTYDLPKENALQLSYSRRVRRPVYNELSSYVTYSDNRNFFSGNPDLNPEFSDVFELGHIKYFENGSLSSAVYYRYTDDKIESIRTVDENGFSATLPENLLNEKAYGAEFTGAIKPYNWWKLDLNINFFRAKTDGSNIDREFVSDTYSWFFRHTSRFNLKQDAWFQFRANYEAPQNIAQGRRKALFFMDLAFNKELFQGKGRLTLIVNDAFNSRRYQTIINGDNFLTERDQQRQRRQINLTLAYKIE